jgi:hypothetical protein
VLVVVADGELAGVQLPVCALDGELDAVPVGETDPLAVDVAAGDCVPLLLPVSLGGVAGGDGAPLTVPVEVDVPLALPLGVEDALLLLEAVSEEVALDVTAGDGVRLPVPVPVCAAVPDGVADGVREDVAAADGVAAEVPVWDEEAVPLGVAAGVGLALA